MKKFLVVLALLASFSAAAVDPRHPGFVDLDGLRGFADQDVVVDLRLGGWLLDLARQAAEESADDDARILSQIDSIRVRVLRGEVDTASIAAAEGLLSELAGRGWEEFATVRDHHDRVHVLVTGDGTKIDGITILAWGHDEEIVLVNVAGAIRPEDIARIISDKGLLHADIDIDV